jgi:hypothetical protein
MRAPLSGRGALLGDFGIGMAAALGGKPRRARIDALGRNRWPSAGASLDLDFVNRQAYVRGVGACTPADVITFSGGAGGTRVNGVGQVVAASGLRYDHDPVTLACKGLLIEEQRTNLLLYSSDYTQATWAKTGISATAPITAPDGSVSMLKLTEDASNGRHGITQNVSLVNGTTYAFSFFAKAANRVLSFYGSGGLNGIASRVDLSNGTVLSGAAMVVPIGSGVYFVWVSGSSTFTGVNALSVDLYNGGGSYAGDGVSGAYLWGAQLEAGAFATSHVPTTAAAVTRTVDLAKVSPIPFYSLAAGTVVVEGDVGPGVASLLNISDAASGGVLERFQLRTGNAGASWQCVYATGGVVGFNFLDGAPVVGSVSKLAASYAYGDFAFGQNGATPKTSATTQLNSPAELRIGLLSTGGAEACNGHVRRIRYWPARLPNAALQALTA